MSLVNLALIFAVLYSRYRSTSLALIIMGSIPLALVGSAAALAIAGEALSVASMVGFITLAGIASRNDKGGQLAHVGANHFELVPQSGGGAGLYVCDATPQNRPVDATSARATARIVVDGRMAQTSFKPAGGNALAAAGVRLDGDWTAIVQAGLAPAKPAVAVRSARAMAVQAKAGPAKVAAHAGH